MCSCGSSHELLSTAGKICMQNCSSEVGPSYSLAFHPCPSSLPQLLSVQSRLRWPAPISVLSVQFLCPVDAFLVWNILLESSPLCPLTGASALCHVSGHRSGVPQCPLQSERLACDHTPLAETLQFCICLIRGENMSVACPGCPSSSGVPPLAFPGSILTVYGLGE